MPTTGAVVRIVNPRLHNVKLDQVEFIIMESKLPSGRVVQSVQRAFDLLERVAAKPDGVRLSDLADGAGLNRSTAHNLLASLEGLGYITQDKKGAAYRLTPKLNRLLRLDVDAERALRSRIRPVLTTLTAASGESTFLGLVSGTDYVCVDAAQSDKPLHLAVRPGERKALIGEALGHALLAADAELATAVRVGEPDLWEQHAREIADAERRGFALDLDSQNAGISCVAIAVTARAAVAIAGPTNRLPKSRLVTIAQRMRQELDQVRPVNQDWL